MTKKNMDKLEVVEGEVVEFALDPYGYYYPEGAKFKSCEVTVKVKGKDSVKLEYLLVPDSLVDSLLAVGRARIFLVKENIGGFVLAIEREGRLEEDIKGALEAPKTAIHIGSMTFPQFRKEFGKPNYEKNSTDSAIGEYAGVFCDTIWDRFYLTVFQGAVIGGAIFSCLYHPQPIWHIRCS